MPILFRSGRLIQKQLILYSARIVYGHVIPIGITIIIHFVCGRIVYTHTISFRASDTITIDFASRRIAYAPIVPIPAPNAITIDFVFGCIVYALCCPDPGV